VFADEDASELTGMTNLMSYHGLEHSYNKFGSKKVKEELSAFLPTLPGNIDTSGNQDNRSVVFSVSVLSLPHDGHGGIAFLDLLYHKF